MGKDDQERFSNYALPCAALYYPGSILDPALPASQLDEPRGSGGCLGPDLLRAREKHPPLFDK